MDNFPRHILDSIWLGRAVLVAGQDLARGETRQLLGSEDSTASLRAALSRPPSELSDRIRAMRLAAPGPDHVEVAQAPWAFVFSSALDTRLASALEAAAPAARRVRRRFVNDVDVDSLRPSPTVLEVMHLSLMSDPTSSDGVVPDATQWSRATRLMQPHVLDHLKDVVGPAHVVIVDGISGIDSLDRDDLVAAFGGLDDRQIVLCAVHQDDTSWLLDTIPGALVYGSALAELLQRAKALAPGKVPGLLLRAEDLAITARSTDGKDDRTIVFRADELRDIRRHLEIVEDTPGRTAPTQRDERLRAFREFLRTPRLRPDYHSFIPDFCLERTAYKDLLKRVNRRIARLRGEGPRGREFEGPIMLAGYPGSGRTTGLHWLGVRLREERLPVAHLGITTDDPDLFAVEQVIRLIEQRLKDSEAESFVILLADGVGADGAKRIDDRLRRAGRRTLVVASCVPYPKDYGLDEDLLDQKAIPLDYVLVGDELPELETILGNVGITISSKELAAQAGTEGFLGMLDRLDSGAREGITQVLHNDFDRFVPDVARALSSSYRRPPPGPLDSAMAAAFARAKIDAPGDLNPHQRELDEKELAAAREFLRMIFSLAWLDQPTPVDLLGRQFPQLFHSYEDVRAAAFAHGFLTEVEIDADSTLALSPVNAGVARALRRIVVGFTTDVLRDLSVLTSVVPWSSGETLGLMGWPKFIFELLRSVSPRGAFSAEFGSAGDVKRVLDILRDLREVRGVRTPQTLLLEAITGREWADRADPLTLNRFDAFDQSRKLLEEARDLVSRRPRSPSRDHQLGSILTAYATTLRRLMEVRIEQKDLPAAQDISRDALSAAQTAQTLEDSWHSFDAAALICYRLARAWQNEPAGRADAADRYLEAIDRFGEILDLGADLGELSPNQLERKGDRQREYLLVTNQLQLAREQALAEAKDGRLSGLCYLLRLDAIDPATNQIRSAKTAGQAFEALAAFPAAFEDQRSIVLLQRLWIGAHLGSQSLDSGPFVVCADENAWRQLWRIADLRVRVGGDDFDPGTGFWLGLALLQLGNLPEARRLLQRMQISVGRTRRRHFDPLVLLSTADCKPRLFRGLVRRREERENMLIFVRDLDLEMPLHRRYLEAGEAIDLKQGDTVDVNVSLNYRGPMAVGPRWAARNTRALAK